MAAKSLKGTIISIIRYVLAAAAGAAIGIGADKLGVENKDAVEKVQTAVTQTIKGEAVSEEQLKASADAAKDIATEVVNGKIKK